MDKYMLQCYEDTHGQRQVSVIDDEVSRCGKWGSVATGPFETQVHLLMVAGEDEGKEPTPSAAAAAAQTEEEAVAADVSPQAGDQGGSPTSDGGYIPSPAYSTTSDEGDGQNPGCQADCKGCMNLGCPGYYSDVSDTKEDSKLATTWDPGSESDEEDQATAPGCNIDCRGCSECYSKVSDDEEVTQPATNQPSDEVQRRNMNAVLGGVPNMENGGADPEPTTDNSGGNYGGTGLHPAGPSSGKTVPHSRTVHGHEAVRQGRKRSRPNRALASDDSSCSSRRRRQRSASSSRSYTGSRNQGHSPAPPRASGGYTENQERDHHFHGRGQTEVERRCRR